MESQQTQTSEPEQSPQPLPRVPPFDPRRLRWQLRVDSLHRAMVLLILAVCLAAGLYWESQHPILSFAAVLAGVGLWIYSNVTSTRVAQSLQSLADLAEQDPDRAEGEIAQALARRPLQRPVRLLLYHRLALVRHEQTRYAEAAAICQTLLTQPLGPAQSVRAHMLLMLVESRLECRDFAGAWWALMELHRTPRTLIERLQTMAMQTRYEVLIGRDAAALWQVDHKIRLTELMPAPQCGAMHAMLAVAATRAKRSTLAAWLHRRAQLLCTPDQLTQAAALLAPKPRCPSA